MNNIQLFQEVKSLFDISEEALNIYRDLKSCTTTKNGIVLAVHININEAEKHFKKSKAILNNKAKFNTSKLEIEFKDRIMKFTSISKLKKRIQGTRIKEIRFYS